MIRILFVDDEPHVLAAVQRMLHRDRDRWEAVFAASGEEALREMENGRFDVLVSDLRMPGMDGATLLRHVQERAPETARIVLSGHAELEQALLALPVAHQYLAKPCDVETLRATIERAAALGALLGDATLRRLVGKTEGLPSLPRTYAALSRVLADPDASLRDIAHTVEQDTAVSARVLRLANSGFFGTSRRVTTILSAVTVLGTTMLRSLVLSADVFRTFASASRLRGFSLDELQRHALLTAGIARLVACDPVAAEQAQMGGLLHDIGQLVLAVCLPDRFAPQLERARREGLPLHRVEAELDGVTHAEIGAYLLSLWGLPYPIVEAVLHHHAPSRSGRAQLDAVVAVHVADMLANQQEGDSGHTGGEVEADLPLLEAIGLADRLPSWRAMAAEVATTAREG